MPSVGLAGREAVLPPVTVSDLPAARVVSWPRAILLVLLVPIEIVPSVPEPVFAPALRVTLPPLASVPPAAPPWSTRFPPALPVPLPPAPALTVSALPAVEAAAVATEIVLSAFDPRVMLPVLLRVKTSVPLDWSWRKSPPVPVLLTKMLEVFVEASVWTPWASWRNWALVRPPSCAELRA